MSNHSLHYANPGTLRHTVFQEPDMHIKESVTQPSTNPIVAPAGVFESLGKAILATAVFRCWHFILFFTIEATVITYVHETGIQDLSISSTLMAVLGTVLGFVISYRSSSAFDRYNEGRKYWSQIVFNIRMFSRTVWFNIPDEPSGNMKLGAAKTVDEYRSRTLVEKKTVLNLLLAYAVALKHYLRGEEGCHYTDLYPLVKFLPAYALPAGITVEALPAKHVKHRKHKKEESEKVQNKNSLSTDALPLPATTSTLRNHTESSFNTEKYKPITPPQHTGVVYLSPARDPPGWHVFDFWPMSLFVRSLQKRGKKVRGRKALRDRAKHNISGNVPLEITLYLSSYIVSMQQRGADSSSIGQMSGALSQMVDALTGLERILQTPIPFSYAIHLWTVTLVWLIALPFQILEPLGWLTIPGVALAAFVYCGLMKCAEELENPFGYDLNDLNLDHFTHNIVRKELQALTALPVPDPAKWAFSPDNDAVFDNEGQPIYINAPEEGHEGASPDEWVRRGEGDIRAALAASSDEHPAKKALVSSNPAGLIAAGAIAGAGTYEISFHAASNDAPVGAEAGSIGASSGSA